MVRTVRNRRNGRKLRRSLRGGSSNDGSTKAEGTGDAAVLNDDGTGDAAGTGAEGTGDAAATELMAVVPTINPLSSLIADKFTYVCCFLSKDIREWIKNNWITNANDNKILINVNDYNIGGAPSQSDKRRGDETLSTNIHWGCPEDEELNYVKAGHVIEFDKKGKKKEVWKRSFGMPSGKLSACMFFCKAFVPKDDELYIELKDYEFQLNESKFNIDNYIGRLVAFLENKNVYLVNPRIVGEAKVCQEISNELHKKLDINKSIMDIFGQKGFGGKGKYWIHKIETNNDANMAKTEGGAVSVVDNKILYPLNKRKDGHGNLLGFYYKDRNGIVNSDVQFFTPYNGPFRNIIADERYSYNKEEEPIQVDLHKSFIDLLVKCGFFVKEYETPSPISNADNEGEMVNYQNQIRTRLMSEGKKYFEGKNDIVPLSNFFQQNFDEWLNENQAHQHDYINQHEVEKRGSARGKMGLLLKIGGKLPNDFIGLIIGIEQIFGNLTSKPKINAKLTDSPPQEDTFEKALINFWNRPNINQQQKYYFGDLFENIDHIPGILIHDGESDDHSSAYFIKKMREKITTAAERMEDKELSSKYLGRGILTPEKSKFDVVLQVGSSVEKNDIIEQKNRDIFQKWGINLSVIKGGLYRDKLELTNVKNVFSHNIEIDDSYEKWGGITDTGFNDAVDKTVKKIKFALQEDKRREHLREEGLGNPLKRQGGKRRRTRRRKGRRSKKGVARKAQKKTRRRRRRGRKSKKH